MSDPQRFQRHGRVTVAAGGRHLAHADGTPFFYLADTAWNGALLSSESDWNEYLADRAAKGFTAIQFILAAPWAGALTDERFQQAYTVDDALGPKEYEINPAFFERMDQRVQAINKAGLLAAPVLAWAAKFGKSGGLNPGAALPQEFLAKFIRFQMDRYRELHVLWILAGDGEYSGWWRSRKWKVIGQSLNSAAPVFLHPMGDTWPYESFRAEDWLSGLGYQSGHSDDTRTMRWLRTGPPAQAWRGWNKPIINLEPCYEGIRNWGGLGPITNLQVRQAMYASLLNAPTAGVAYGAHGVWSWESTTREPLNHPGSGIAPPWRQAMNLPGSFDVQRLAAFFNSIDWWRLRPARELLIAGSLPEASCAATEIRDLIICYLPRGGKISLGLQTEATWFDPRTGDRHAAQAGSAYHTPSNDDWLLVARTGK